MITTLYRIAFGKGRKVDDEAKKVEGSDSSEGMKGIIELELKLQWIQNEVCHLRATQRKINKDLKCLND